VRGIAIAVVCLLAQGCAKTNAYKCTASDQCVLNGQAGTCAPEGYCAFPDPGCPSGSRFESGAGGGFGGQCTAAPDAPLPPCGALGQQCCTGEQAGSGGPCVAGTYCNAGMCDECVTDMTFGHDIGCYLKKDHTVWCAGNQANGQLGNGMGSAGFIGSAVQVVDATGPITDATALGGGYNQNCAVRANGAVYCWGRNYDGQLGDNTTNDSSKAVQVQKAMGSGTAPLTGIVDVDGGGGFTCAHDTTGIVWCWGYNGSGQLGDGTTNTRHIAAPAMAGSAAFVADSVYSADNFVCAKKGGDYLCWGNDGNGQFGDGSNGDFVNPTKVATTSALGLGNYHACWVNADTTISCAGANYHGQMGNGSGNDFVGLDQQTPGPVLADATTPFMNAVELAAGGAMTCARTTDGHVWCWGDNKYGQIGDGSPTPYPTQVLDAATFTPLEHADRLVAKYAHICAHTTDAGWKCWGRGSSGELADGQGRSRGMATPLGLSCPLIAWPSQLGYPEPGWPSRSASI